MDPLYYRRLIFLAEWFQPEASLMRNFYVNYYLADNAVEVVDKKTKKIFLRRTKLDDLTERDFYPGAKVNIFGRQYSITDYGDEKTKMTLTKCRRKTFIMLKTNAIPHLGTILEALIDSTFNVTNGRMVQMNAEQVKIFLGERIKSDTESSVLLHTLISGPSIGFELATENAVEKLKLCHTRDPENRKNKQLAPLIALFDRDDIRINVYCAPDDEYAKKDRKFFFNPASDIRHTLKIEKTTLAIIKPHIIKEGKLGKIINEITNNGYSITCLRMLTIERINCEEFYDVYRGIIPEYISMVSHLASGPCMALELLHTDPTKQTQAVFRQFCGPVDPELGKLLRPHTIRAKFGSTKAKNAIHCTDLPDDTFMELQYLFNILD